MKAKMSDKRNVLEIRLKGKKKIGKKKDPRAQSLRVVQDGNADIQMQITGPKKLWEMRHFG